MTITPHPSLNIGLSIRILLGAAAAIAIGCSPLSHSIPETHRYQVVTTPVNASVPDRVTLQVSGVGGAGPYQDTGIATQTSSYKIDSYHFHRWTAPPTEIVAERLRAIVYRPAGSADNSKDPAVATLEAQIKAFQQVNQGGTAAGLVDIDFCIYPTTPFQRAYWCQEMSKSTPAKNDSPEAAAEAVSASLDDVLHQFAGALPDAVSHIPSPKPAKSDAPTAG